MRRLRFWLDHLWTRYVRRRPGWCIDGECAICAAKDCPYGDWLHYHHDDCPSCYSAEGEPPHA